MGGVEKLVEEKGEDTSKDKKKKKKRLSAFFFFFEEWKSNYMKMSLFLLFGNKKIYFSES